MSMNCWYENLHFYRVIDILETFYRLLNYQSLKCSGKNGIFGVGGWIRFIFTGAINNKHYRAFQLIVLVSQAATFLFYLTITALKTVSYHELSLVDCWLFKRQFIIWIDSSFAWALQVQAKGANLQINVAHPIRQSPCCEKESSSYHEDFRLLY